MKYRSSFLRKLPAILFCIVLAVFLLLFIRYQRKPEILTIDRLTAVSGDSIELTGRFFGDESEGAKLIVGAQPLTSAGIIEWHDDRIVARVPRMVGAVLIKIENRSGTSNGVVLANAARFPQVEYGAWLPGAPFVEYIEPGAGAPGTLVTLRGDGFGNGKGGSGAWVNRADESNLFGSEAPNLELYTEITSFDLWTDSMIRFWIPTNVASGSIYIRRGQRFSNPIQFDVTQGSGSFEIGETVRWSLRQEVSITGIGAFPGNSLYLRLPIPVGAGSGRIGAAVFEDNDGLRAAWLRRDGFLDIFQLNELTSGESRQISRQIVVSTSAVKASVNPDALAPYDPTHPELAASLAVDDWIRPDLVAQTSARIVGTLRNDWRKSQAVYAYVADLLEWSDEPPSRSIPEYLSTKLADSEGYSFLFCSLARAALVPARPIGGILVDSEKKSRRWWWAEIWLEGLGWVPVDPALGDAKGNHAWMLAEGRPQDYYFGGVGERHIAFSRGIEVSGPLQPNPDLRRPLEVYSLQGVWEEVSGNLHSYSSDWPVPRVVAMYR